MMPRNVIAIIVFYTNSWVSYGQQLNFYENDNGDRWPKKSVGIPGDVGLVKFTTIGPSIMGGRVVDIAVNDKNPVEFYVAYATGGLWYTRNNGNSFVPRFDSAIAITIGAIAVDWRKNIIYIGTGEANGSQDTRMGIGLFSSNDSGKTWQHKGLKSSGQIGKICLDPNQPGTIWVAAMGKLSGGGDRGAYKSTDFGNTWSRKLYIDNSTGVVDIAINPSNSDEVFASAWHLVRKNPWHLSTTGTTSGIYKSLDGGNRWILLSGSSFGIPKHEYIGRIGLAIYPKQPKILYAVVHNKFADNKKASKVEVYRSDDGGLYWKKQNNSIAENGRYFGKIAVSPCNDKKIVILSEVLEVSIDAGKTLPGVADFTNMHVDHHALWINPLNDNHMISGNDGGCNITYDGVHWGKTKSPPVGQFYSVTVDNSFPYNVYGGLQDNGVWYGPSNYDEEKLNWYTDYPYKMLVGDDGMLVQVDTRNNTTVYAGVQFGSYVRLHSDRNLSRQSIYEKYDKRHFKGLMEEEQRVGVSLRFNWKTPILLSRHNQDILYLGANKFFRSLNQGDTLIALSKDLTNGPKEGNIVYGTITSIAESLLHFGLLYVGTDDGNIQISSDGGYHWKLINDPNNIKNIIPKGFNVTSIAASRFNEGTIYTALNGRAYDDLSPLIFESSDFGKTWQQIGNNLPSEPINVVKEDIKNENILYVGTDGGLYVSFNKGKSFTKWYGGLPKSVIVSDIAIQERENEIVIATYGRSLYKAKLDEIQKLASTQHNK